MDAINHKKLTERLKEKEATLADRQASLERLEKEIEALISGSKFFFLRDSFICIYFDC